MRKILFLILISLIFVGCQLDTADDIDSFPKADYSHIIQDDQYIIPVNTPALTIFNCFYNEFGYGEFDINGQYSHTESATLNGKLYSDTITKTINKMKIYHVKDVESKGETISSFYVLFFTTDNTVFEFRYQWQYSNTNAWKNNKSDGLIIISK